MKPEYCIDCAFHRIIKDPDPYDGFNYDDVAMVCTKLKNKDKNTSSKYLSDHSEFAIISCSERPYQINKAKPREDCPLK